MEFLIITCIGCYKDCLINSHWENCIATVINVLSNEIDSRNNSMLNMLATRQMMLTFQGFVQQSSVECHTSL